jgi:formylglycine-generating enzyme required for sulfatase activity/tRNA A-37 threonylcarbamoyl transferase component Bud32
MSSAADPTALFLSAIRQSTLLSADQLAAFNVWAEKTKPDIQEVAKELNRRRWLTPFQIKEIFKGRGKELTLGRYSLLDLLGEGGMGRVYKAHDTRLGRDVALKVIRKEKLAHPLAAARFEQEMLVLGQLKSHPNVVHAFTADQVGDLHFVVMELIDGSDLTRLIREKGPMPVPDACECIRQAALGLQHAWENGLVHRDIKPSNLLLTRGTKQVKLVDLGLARLTEAPEEAGRLTQEGFVIGTPDFLAPEQARNPGGVDIRADIYALGGTLFFLLTGKVPYEGANPTEKLLKHCTEPPPRLLPLRPDALPQVEQIMHWCMAKRPEDRPQTPVQLALALQPYCPGGVPVSGGYPVPAPTASAPVLQLPEPDHDPQRSSQLFRLPDDAATARPGRPRARPKAKKWSVVPLLVILGGLFLIGLIGAGIYKQFLGGPPPVEAFTNGVGMRMVRLEGGGFRMGSPDAEPGRNPDEGPVREVQIRGPFLVSATEVTHGQFKDVMGRSPRPATRGNDYPVDNVTYDEAVDFCRRLTEREKGQPHARPGWAYRLPTEAEWEYACRAGTTTPFWCGDALGPKQGTVNADGKGDRRDPDPKRLPTKAGQCDPNRWGLFDVSGNVAEWCGDWYKPGYGGDATDNPTGPPAGEKRVVRGGSFRTRPSDARSAARFALPPGERHDDVGFRVVYAPR